VATAPIQPLAWELPYAAGVALKRPKKKKKEEEEFEEPRNYVTMSTTWHPQKVNFLPIFVVSSF